MASVKINTLTEETARLVAKAIFEYMLLHKELTPDEKERLEYVHFMCSHTSINKNVIVNRC